jgi:hypothetical protein
MRYTKFEYGTKAVGEEANSMAMVIASRWLVGLAAFCSGKLGFASQAIACRAFGTWNEEGLVARNLHPRLLRAVHSTLGMREGFQAK